MQHSKGETSEDVPTTVDSIPQPSWLRWRDLDMFF